MAEPITVFVVEDSPIVMRIWEQLITQTDGLTLVGKAHNGQAALAPLLDLKPQVLCTDLWMDGWDGAQLIQWTMAHCPCPILVMSEDGHRPEIARQLKTLGALAVMGKPIASQAWDGTELASTIKLIAGVTVFTKPLHSEPVEMPPLIKAEPKIVPVKTRERSSAPIDLVGIGVSTGGPKAMQWLLSQLPRNFPVPIVCTQHITPGFLAQHVQWLNRVSALEVLIAQEGTNPEPGYVYYAPEAFHLGLTAQGKFWYDAAPPLGHHRPSVTVMFEAIAQRYGSRSLAMQLTGMGNDGAQGLAAIAQAGGVTVAQNEASSVVFGMPKAAIALGAAQHVLDLSQMPQFLWERVVAPRLAKGFGSLN